MKLKADNDNGLSLYYSTSLYFKDKILIELQYKFVF